MGQEGYIGLVIGIIAILGVGFLFLNQQATETVDLSQIENQLISQAGSIAVLKTDSSNAISQVSSLQTQINSVKANVLSIDFDRNTGSNNDIEDLEDDVNDLQDVWDCLEDFAAEEVNDLNDAQNIMEDLDECLDDI